MQEVIGRVNKTPTPQAKIPAKFIKNRISKNPKNDYQFFVIIFLLNSIAVQKS